MHWLNVAGSLAAVTAISLLTLEMAVGSIRLGKIAAYALGSSLLIGVLFYISYYLQIRPFQNWTRPLAVRILVYIHPYRLSILSALCLLDLWQICPFACQDDGSGHVQRALSVFENDKAVCKNNVNWGIIQRKTAVDLKNYLKVFNIY